eukprot:3171159-Amphidinium_carterae.1
MGYVETRSNAVYWTRKCSDISEGTLASKPLAVFLNGALPVKCWSPEAAAPITVVGAARRCCVAALEFYM